MLVILLMFLPAVSSALPVRDLYDAELLVASRNQSELTEGARAGLLQVLVRVSGTTDVADHRMITSALRNPAQYYYQYGYESTDRTLVVDGKDVPARILRISFEPSAVSRLLRQAGFPVWGSNRPGVMVWLAYNEGLERRVLTEADQGQLMDALNYQARYRGLPMLFPLMDLEDAVRLSTAEIWGQFLDRIDVASMRYNPDVILTGRVLRDTSGQWSGRWSYRIESRWKAFDNVASTPDELVTGVVRLLADELAKRFAVDSSQGSLMLQVEGVRNLADYAAVTAYIESLTPVVEAFVVNVKGDKIVFNLSTEGQSEQLMEIIGLDEKMVLVSAGDATLIGSPMHYRWMERRQ